MIEKDVPQLIMISRGKYQGIIGGFDVLGYALGPVLGGLLAKKVSWRVGLSYKTTVNV
jgi:MFS family permease